jgi:hypothetical protein
MATFGLGRTGMIADEPAAGIAEELAELCEVARAWAQDHPTPCGFCPICQLIAALPLDRSDLGEKVLQAADIVMAAARSLAELLSGPVPGPDDPPGGVQERARTTPRVEHINIS